MCVIVMRKKNPIQKLMVLRGEIWCSQQVLRDAIKTVVFSIFSNYFCSASVRRVFYNYYNLQSIPSIFMMILRWISELRVCRGVLHWSCCNSHNSVGTNTRWCVSVTACRFPPSALDVALILLWKSERRKLH